MAPKNFNKIIASNTQYNLKYRFGMALSLNTTNKIFFFIGLVFEVWFILMYALDYGYKFDAAVTAVR